MPFRLRTLGGLSLEADDAPLAGRTTQRRRLALLAILAAAPTRGVSRDKLLGLLWPERDAEHARHALSQALYAIRHDLGTDAVLSGVDDVRLNPQVVTSDVADLNAALEAGELQRVVALYRGPFLDGFFLSDAPELERWIEAERERLGRVCGRALGDLAAAALEAGDAHGAAEHLRRSAALDPLNSEVAARLMRALAAAGDRAGALRHHRIHAALVRGELEIEPDAFLERLAEELASSGGDERPADPAAPAPPASPVPPLTASVAPAPRGGRLRHRRWLAGVGSLALVSVAWSVIARPWAPAVGSSHVLLLGEISGADTLLARAVREALGAALEQEPGVRIVPEGAIQQSLELMRRPGETPLTPDVARQVAQRYGAAVVLTGAVQALGGGAQLVVRLSDAGTGATLATAIERPLTDAQVLPAVARIASEIRARILGVRPDPSRALPAVSTTSLAALRTYALARAAMAGPDRPRAIELLEAALVHDSAFALAHYYLGDLYWHVDQQSRSDYHMERALALSERLGPRERLIVRARYEQLMLDRPDSALAVWRVLAAAYPHDGLAFEGMAWSLRALGNWRGLAAAADSALRLDPAAGAPNLRNLMLGLLALRDTTAARNAMRALGTHRARWETELYIALARGDHPAALRWVDSLWPGRGSNMRPYLRHLVFHAMGRPDSAARELSIMQGWPRVQAVQTVARALLLQAEATVDDPAQRSAVRRAARDALTRLEAVDLSPPAMARIGERIAIVSARTGDRETIERVRRLLRTRDAGRGLRTYRIAENCLDGALAFARGEYARAAALLEQTRQEHFLARTVATLVLLHADALRAAGDTANARVLYQRLTWYRYADDDGETWFVIARLASGRLAGTESSGSARLPDGGGARGARAHRDLLRPLHGHPGAARGGRAGRLGERGAGARAGKLLRTPDRLTDPAVRPPAGWPKWPRR